MAARAFTQAYLAIAANVLSAYVDSLTFNYGVTELDGTTMGDTTLEKMSGLKEWSLDITFKPDTASALDAILWPLVGTVVAIEIRPEQGGVSGSNPKFTGNALFVSYSPLGGSVNSTHMAPIRLVSAGAIARAES